jgi:multicomponent K+:H+ antiporter subunit E
MSRLLPSPLLSAAILVFWLLLNNSAHPAHLVLGALLALALPPLAGRVVEHRPRLRAPGRALALAGVVFYDVVKSNIEVALLILGPQARIRSRFIAVPCELDDPCATVVLAGIITMTPGTLSVDISADRRTITIHSLHAPDPQQIIDSIKTRYEQPLAEIFSCSTTRS